MACVDGFFLFFFHFLKSPRWSYRSPSEMQRNIAINSRTISGSWGLLVSFAREEREASASLWERDTKKKSSRETICVLNIAIATRRTPTRNYSLSFILFNLHHIICNLLPSIYHFLPHSSHYINARGVGGERPRSGIQPMPSENSRRHWPPARTPVRPAPIGFSSRLSLRHNSNHFSISCIRFFFFFSLATRYLSFS